ncbi:MAG: HU family DNA-binding protein [Gammaproteobacteria bacterium]|nr:HU family DNA-binding protein [Gammaproteobacteria bacterium]
MHKPELAEAIAAQTGISRQTAAEVLNAVLDEIANALAFDRKVSLPGLGVLAPVQRQAHTGKNPATGQALEIPAQRSVAFRPAKKLKDALNEV